MNEPIRKYVVTIWSVSENKYVATHVLAYTAEDAEWQARIHFSHSSSTSGAQLQRPKSVHTVEPWQEELHGHWQPNYTLR